MEFKISPHKRGSQALAGQQDTTRRIKFRSVARYTMMPEILPRIRNLGVHLGHFAYLIALILNSAKLIPNGHPALNSSSIGRYGVRETLAIGANNIEWRWKNADQIAIFSAIAVGLMMILIQAFLIAIYAVLGTASAQEATSFFLPSASTYEVEKDVVLIALAQVFGDLNGFWGDGVAANAPGVNSGVQAAIHQMLSLYSMATMVIAVIIVLYHILTVIGEAAKTGTPFGQRFNSLWAPIRLIIALGLLVPLGSGLNSAQYATLWIAKMGSGLGTNIWHRAAEAITQEPERYQLAEFEVPWVRDAAARIFMMEVCRHSENKYNEQNGNSAIAPIFEPLQGDSDKVFGFTLEYKDNQSRPRLCGKIQVKMTTNTDSDVAKAMSVSTKQVAQASEKIIRELTKEDGVLSATAKEFSETKISVGGAKAKKQELAKMYQTVMTEADRVEGMILKESVQGFEEAYKEQVASLRSKMQNSWVYSGVWYLEFGRLLQANKDLTVSAIPNMTAGSVTSLRHGLSAWWNRGQVGTEGLNSTGADFNTDVQLDWTQKISGETATAITIAARHYFENINDYIDTTEVSEACADVNADSGLTAKIGCAVFEQIVPKNLVILADPKHKMLDPMTSLINAGKEITDRSILFVSMGLGATGASAAIGAIPVVGSILSSFAAGIAKVLLVLGTIGLGAGLILYFLLPVYPFIYLFFAAVSWIMEIFEAIVAMPLWALAHLRIDGDGMPGQAAITGYQLLLAILLRPTFIVIGLIGGALIFNAAVYMLQELFREVILMKNSGSATGIELLIYTLVFTYICYIAALTSFKLVDQVPNQILRWMGSGASTFSDNKTDPIGGNNEMAIAAAGIVGGQVTGGLSEAAAGLGSSVRKGGEKGAQWVGDALDRRRGNNPDLSSGESAFSEESLKRGERNTMLGKASAKFGEEWRAKPDVGKPDGEK